MIWGAELEHELVGLGTPRRYASGTCLAHCLHRPPIVRRITAGQVDVFVHIPGGTAHVSRAEDGAILGVHSNLYANEQPHICWKAVSHVECHEILWSDIESRCKENSRMDGILQRIGQIQHYSIVLAAHPVFSILDMHTRSRIFAHATVRMLAPGEHLIHKHGKRSHLYLLVTGKVSIRPENQAPIMLESGDILGEISLFGYSPEPTADAVADSFSEIIEFLDADMIKTMRSNQSFRQAMTDLIERRISV